MKFLHTGDWHLGKRLERFERVEEQQAVLEEICQIADAESVDLILISGDLFDTFNPPNQAIEDFYLTVRRLSQGGKRAVIAIAGNHDSPQRIEAPDPLARANGIVFAGYPDSQPVPFTLETGLRLTTSAPGFAELQLPGVPFPVRLLLTPYANETRLRKALGSESQVAGVLKTHWQTLADTHCDEKGVNLLVTHLYMMPEGGEAPEEPEDERPIRVGNASAIFTNCIPPQIQYAALGHLHRYQNMSGGPCPVVYPSSILGYSFSEAGQQKYVVIGEVKPGKPVTFDRKPLTAGFPLVRKTFDQVDAAVEWLNQNQECFVELTIRTDSYIDGQDRRRMVLAHPRILGPIPEFTGEHPGATEGAGIDLNKSREELFKSYFKDREGVDPSQEIINLLKEIMGEEYAV